MTDQRFAEALRKELKGIAFGASLRGAPAWVPTPLSGVRRWIEQNKDAQVDLVFPTVYEEDRSGKIKDLAALEVLKVITHRRLAEQCAKEIGFEQYDYDEEMSQIAQEQESALLKSPPEPAIAGVFGMGGKAGPGEGAPAPPGPAAEDEGGEDDDGVRAELARDRAVTRAELKGPERRSAWRALRASRR